MTDDNDSQVGGTRRRASTGCKPLLDAATPELFQVNAFRITGLPVDATARQISKHFDSLKQMAELGLGASVHTGTYALKPPPTLDQIREAHQRLKDPEQRLIDEFFWFWPEQFGKSTSDAAIQALAGGDGDTAFQIWRTKETNPTDGVVALHNVAIVRYLTALEWENATAKQGLDDERRRKIETYWRDAFKRWEHLATDDTFWEKITVRVKQMDDARLTSGFVRRMRATLPEALDKVNGQLALRYAEAGQLELAQIHVQFMRETNQGLDNIERTAELLLGPASSRLKEQIQRAQRTADHKPADAAHAAREVLEVAQRTLALFVLFFGKDSDQRNDFSDDVAALCNRLQVTYHKATGDNKTCLELLQTALPFAISSELREQIQANVGTLEGNLAFKKLEPIYALLKEIQESHEHPRFRLARLSREVVPQFSILSVGRLDGSEASTEVLDSAAIVLREISLAAWNTHQDRETAIAASDLALKLARGPEIKRRLIEDQTALRRLQPQPAAPKQSSNKPGAGCLVVIAICIGLALIGAFNSNNTSPTSTSYTPPVGNQDSSDKRTYRISPSMSSELSRDRQAIDSAKLQASLLESEVARLAREIDSERTFLDSTSQFAVDGFNRKVERYNAKVEQGKSQNRSVNQMVDNYNAKLRQSGR